MKYILPLLILISTSLSAQHGVGTNWESETAIPRYNESLNAKQRGVLYNNMVVTSTGRIIISTSEINPSNMNQLYGHYLTYSDDGGESWESPVPFTPTDLVIGGSSVKLAIDKNDNLYVLWNSFSPSAIFISKLDKDLNVINDSVRVVSKMLYGNFATHFTIDKYNRIHVMWHEGSPGTSNIAEAFYTRSTNNGLTWETVTPLSSDDGHHSAFPHAEFDTAGDTLAIAWRDSVGVSSQWDVYMVFSTDGGQSWSPSPTPVISGMDADWDPDLLIDPLNRIHLFYTKYPKGDPFDGARNYYQYSDDAGASWSLPNFPTNGIISGITRSQLIEGTRYDEQRNILYVTWKDERDFNHSNGEVEGDIMLAYSPDRGLSWSTPEFITDRHDSTVGFKSGALLPTGEYCVNYEVLSEDDINDPGTLVRVYFRKRQAITTDVKSESEAAAAFQLNQNYPNPFNPSTTIEFRVSSYGLVGLGEPAARLVSLKVYDILGREVATLVNEYQQPGNYNVEFRTQNSELSSGVYFYILKVGGLSKIRKMILLQ